MCTKNYCDYDRYFIDQAGGNLDIAYYRPLSYQRGYGRFSSIAKRFGIPALKYLFKHGVEFGKNLYTDIRDGKHLKDSLKSSLLKRASSALGDLDKKISQSGSGVRKKPRILQKRKRKSKRLIKRFKTKNIRKNNSKKTSKRKIFIKDIFN
jgi:hypothetical protein